MPRLTPKKAIAAYKKKGNRPSKLVWFHPDEHLEEMHDLATGLIGALLKLKLPSLSGPEIGSRIPLVVTNIKGDLLRIFVDPHISVYGPRIEKGRESVELTALSYKGEPFSLDTEELWYEGRIELALELQRQDKLLSRIPRELPVSTPSSETPAFRLDQHYQSPERT